ncbi:MAG: superoxide dismutase [Cu-Zn] SodC [Calothrix sp. MO_167.B42]|nr:superoxide dismutase [Cu-Zn] SodC [Calothrix sp. MO_167.B42]
MKIAKPLWLIFGLMIGLIIVVSPNIALAGYRNKTISTPIHLVDNHGTGREIGTVKLQNTRFGLLLTPDLEELEPGVHGFHVHENPSCEPADRNGQKVAALAAGGHFDPRGTGKHEGPYGRGHLGDLPPLFVIDEGTATIPVLAPRLRVRKVRNRSFIIHMNGDNFSDTPEPLGGGGARVACGVIR